MSDVGGGRNHEGSECDTNRKNRLNVIVVLLCIGIEERVDQPSQVCAM